MGSAGPTESKENECQEDLSPMQDNAAIPEFAKLLWK